MSVEAAFWDVVGPQVGWVHVQLRRMGVPERDLDDVTQAVLLQVHGRWAEYDPARSIRPWLMAFVARVAANHRRLVARRRETLGDSDDLRETMVDPSTLTQAQSRAESARALVLTALGALDDDRRAVLVMMDIEGMSAAEASTALEIPVNTAYSRLRLAREDFTAAVRRIQAQRGER